MPSLLKMMAEMGLNIGPFQAGMDKAKVEAQRGGESIGRAFSGMVGKYFGIAALASFGASIVRRVSEIKDLSEQFNISTDDVQNFGKAFEDSGLKVSDAGAAMDKLNKARREAVEGNQGLRDSFEAFGIGVDRLNNSAIKTETIFRDIGARIRDGNVGDKQRAAMMDLMGKSGARFVESMKAIDQINPSLIDAEQVKEVDEAERHIREIRQEMEKITVLSASRLLKGDFFGTAEASKWVEMGKAFQEAGERLREFVGGGGLVPGGNRKRGKGGPPLPPRDYAAIKDTPEDIAALRAEQSKALYEDGIRKKQLLATGMAQALVEEKLRDIAFGKLRHTEQVDELRKRQAKLGEEIKHQDKQSLDDLFTKEVREENIANLKLQQLQYEEQILAIKKQSGVNLEGFRKFAQAGGTNPANYGPPAAPAKGGGITDYGKTLIEFVNVLKQVERNTGRRGLIITGR